MSLTLRGNDHEFIDLIDQGDGVTGILGVIAAKIAAHTGLVAVESDARSDAARLLRRAAELLDQH
jgi:hypothetical protein